MGAAPAIDSQDRLLSLRETGAHPPRVGVFRPETSRTLFDPIFVHWQVDGFDFLVAEAGVAGSVAALPFAILLSIRVRVL